MRSLERDLGGCEVDANIEHWAGKKIAWCDAVFCSVATAYEEN